MYLNTDIIGLIASRCDPITALRLVCMNKHIYAALQKDMSKIRFRIARGMIKEHVAELPERILHFRPPQISSIKYDTEHTIIRRTMCIRTQVLVFNNGRCAKYVAIVSKPNKHGYYREWIELYSDNILHYADLCSNHKWVQHAYGTTIMLHMTKENRQRLERMFSSPWTRTRKWVSGMLQPQLRMMSRLFQSI